MGKNIWENDANQTPISWTPSLDASKPKPGRIACCTISAKSSRPRGRADDAPSVHMDDVEQTIVQVGRQKHVHHCWFRYASVEVKFQE